MASLPGFRKTLNNKLSSASKIPGNLKGEAKANARKTAKNLGDTAYRGINKLKKFALGRDDTPEDIFYDFQKNIKTLNALVLEYKQKNGDNTPTNSLLVKQKCIIVANFLNITSKTYLKLSDDVKSIIDEIIDKPMLELLDQNKIDGLLELSKKQRILEDCNKTNAMVINSSEEINIMFGQLIVSIPKIYTRIKSIALYLPMEEIVSKVDEAVFKFKGEQNELSFLRLYDKISSMTDEEKNELRQYIQGMKDKYNALLEPIKDTTNAQAKLIKQRIEAKITIYDKIEKKLQGVNVPINAKASVVPIANVTTNVLGAHAQIQDNPTSISVIAEAPVSVPVPVPDTVPEPDTEPEPEPEPEPAAAAAAKAGKTASALSTAASSHGLAAP
jgi:hypothetical protein